MYKKISVSFPARFGLLGILALIIGLCAGCAATRFEKNLAQVTTTGAAAASFGPPAITQALPDGGQHLEWRLHQRRVVPGQYVTYTYTYGYDRDGFPVQVTREVWEPEHFVIDDCTLVLISDSTGAIRSSKWSGNSCDRLSAWRNTQE